MGAETRMAVRKARRFQAKNQAHPPPLAPSIKVCNTCSERYLSLVIPADNF